MKQEKLAAKEAETYGSGKALEAKSAKSVILIALKKVGKDQKNLKKTDKTCKYYPFL